MLGLNAPRPLQIIESPALKDTSLNRIERAIVGRWFWIARATPTRDPLIPRSIVDLSSSSPARRNPSMSQCACAAD
jgi:hypothetical protein